MSSSEHLSYSQRADAWETIDPERYDGFTATLGFSEAARDALDLVGASSGDRILDLGCGTGIVSLEAARRGCEVVAIDRSRTMLDSASERIERAGMGAVVQFEQMDAQELDFADAEFDHVVSSMVQAFVPDPARSLGEATRVTRPGGGIAFTAAGPPDSIASFGLAHQAMQEVVPEHLAKVAGQMPQWAAFADPWEMIRVLTGCGLERIEARSVLAWAEIPSSDYLPRVIPNASPGNREVLGNLTEEQVERVFAVVQRIVEERFGDEPIVLEAGYNVAGGYRVLEGDPKGSSSSAVSSTTDSPE
ncbi:MAG: class I SAM-dependent methyltransferase [Thermoanaerobaculia bacterium]|nr:class I SAM-dependent methyltransferase [Thermoanaerobaculia bacterium]